MRILAFARNLFLVFVIASPAMICAQFQQPTDEELKMTSDPKAPGAAAVYLNVAEITDDPLHYHSFYARIKVLQEKGKELATVEIPYMHGGYRVDDIKGRTIHSDGTVIPLTGKPEDLLILKTTTNSGNRQVNRKVFTLPSAEVGSILEYRYDLRYDDNNFSSPQWEVQRPFFVHKAHYSFTPFKAFLPGSDNATNRYLVDQYGHVANTLLWWSILPAGLKVNADIVGHYTFDLNDIPPAPQEEWMPPIRSLLYQVVFYYTYASNIGDFWTSEAKRWSKAVDHFAEPTKPIKEAVAGLIGPGDGGDGELDKAKKIYKAVQALENTDYSRKKGKSELKQLNLKEAKRAEDTWAQKSGSSEDIALLYLAMVRAAGLTGFAMKVVNRDDGVFAPGYLRFDQLDDDIVVVNIGGKEIVLDPGEKMCPFQTVHWKHSGANGIRQIAEGRALWSSPYIPYTANTLARTGDLTLDEHGAISGTLRLVMSGQEALRWRQAAIQNDLDEVKKQFDRELESMTPEGVEAHVDHFLSLDDPDLNLMAVVKVNGTLGASTSKRLLLPAFFFQTRGGRAFVDQAKRLEPVDMHYGDQISDQIVYHLPAGFDVEGAPQDAKIAWEGHAVLATKTKTGAGQITVARLLSRAFTMAKPEEYQELRGFYQKVAAADQGQLVLAVSTATKGN